MQSISLVNALNHNLLDEICRFLKPHEIVSVFSINKHFNKYWISKIAEKIFPNMQISSGMSIRDIWSITKIKYFDQENLKLPAKHFSMLGCNFPQKISFDPIKIVFLLPSNLIIWFPESDEVKEIYIERNAYLSAYDGNTLAVLHDNKKIVFYSDDGVIKQESNFSRIKLSEVSQMLCLKDGAYLLLVTKSNYAIFIHSLTGKIIKKQKHEEAISKIKVLYDDTVAYLSGRQLYKLSPWLITPLIKFPGKSLGYFWYDRETQKIIVNSLYQGEIKELPSVIVGNFNGSLWFVNGSFLVMSEALNGRKFLVNSKDTQIQYEIPETGGVISILGDSKMFLVHISRFHYEDQYIQVLYFYMWGKKEPFYEKKFSLSVEILDFKFPYVIYKVLYRSGVNYFGVMRL